MLKLLIQDIDKGGLYRFVRYGEPNLGERFISNSGTIGTRTPDTDEGIVRVIVEPFIPNDED